MSNTILCKFCTTEKCILTSSKLHPSREKSRLSYSLESLEIYESNKDEEQNKRCHIVITFE